MSDKKPARFDFTSSFDLALPGGVPPADPSTALMMRVVEDLCMKNRTLVSDGFDESLDYIGRIVPLKVHRVRSGTAVWSWTAPKKWVVREAWLKKDGKVLADFARHPMELVSYSTPFSGKLSWEDLKPHLHFDAERPDAIPYVYKYYRPHWGFCVPYNVYKTLGPGTYEAKVDTALVDGAVAVGESVLRGETEDSVIVSAHLCHPGQANDGLSGVAAGIALFKRLAELPSRRYTYRLVLCPENIGSLCYLFKNQELIPTFKHGIFLEMLGNKNHLKVQRSKRGDNEVDQLAELALAKQGAPYGVGAFRKVVCNDEINFDGPGIDVPTVSITRWPYPEYHTSDDNPSMISAARMKESLDVLWELVTLLERNYVPKRKYRGNVFLSRYGLYEDLNGDDTIEQVLLNFEGELSILEIARKIGVPFERVHGYAERFRNAGLVEALGAAPAPAARRKRSRA